MPPDPFLKTIFSSFQSLPKGWERDVVSLREHGGIQAKGSKP